MECCSLSSLMSGFKCTGKFATPPNELCNRFMSKDWLLIVVLLTWKYSIKARENALLVTAAEELSFLIRDKLDS